MLETDTLSGYRGVMADVTVAKQAQAQVVHLAHHDALTGLVKRAYFHQRLDALLAAPGERGIGLVSIDLDGFSRSMTVTDIPLATRCWLPLPSASASWWPATVSRHGSVATSSAIETAICEQPAMETFCRWLIQTLSEPYIVAGHDISVGASVGVAFAPMDSRTTEELFKNADAALLNSGLAPHRLEVEITEAVLINDAETALDILRRIRAIGVKIALDDFGTGYSSLSYLRNFPFDKVKIDRSFVTEIESRRDSQVIVQGIHDIAFGLGMTITAEGVETSGQAEQLRIAGCHELQGYLFSKPQPDSRIPDLFRPHPIAGTVNPDIRRKQAS